MRSSFRLVAVAVCCMLLAGCSPTYDVVSESFGLPSAPSFDQYREDGEKPEYGWDVTDNMPVWLVEPIAGWVAEGESFAIVTWASSSGPGCFWEADGLKVVDDGHVEVDFFISFESFGFCTDDLAPRAHVFNVPDTVQPENLSITVSGVRRGFWGFGNEKAPTVELQLEP